MNYSYSDITSRIPEQPSWWDEAAVPRYCDFEPSCAANTLADETVLMEIRCQNCNQPFTVLVSRSVIGCLADGAHWLADRIKDGSINYGAPPNIECCPRGIVMTSVPVRVLQYWRRNSRGEWQRYPEFEIEVIESAEIAENA